MRLSLRWIAVVLCVALGPSVSAAVNVRLLHDGLTGPRSGAAQYAPELILSSGLVYAVRDFPGVGGELWRLDPEWGVRLLRDIRPGEGSSYPNGFVSFRDRTWFWADDGGNGRGIWASDGTERGTRLAIPVWQGGGGNDFGPPPVSGGGSLWYVGPAGLWRSDGAAEAASLKCPGRGP